MPGKVHVDTDLMQVTAQRSGAIADNLVAHARTLSAGLEFVRNNWHGQAGDAFRAATRNQEQTLNQLVQRLHVVAGVVRQGGQGFDSQDAGAGSRVATEGGQYLNQPLNS